VKPICFGAEPGGLDMQHRFLALLDSLDLLDSADRKIETLCDVDTMIVRSLQDCVISRPLTPERTGTASLLSGLVITMAQEWRKQGELRRADELYRHFFEGYGEWWQHGQKYGSLFKEWASVKLALGALDAAKDLASRYVAYNRDLYDCDRTFLPSLVRSLEFQVDMLESLYDTEKVAQARTELERLAAIANEHCIGDRCRGCIEGVCRGSPGFTGACLRSFERKE